MPKPVRTDFTPVHSQATRDRFYAALKKRDGNVRAAAHDAEVAVQTARYWLKTAKIDDFDVETRAVIIAWKGTVEEKIDKTLYAIFDEVNKRLSKASLDDMTKAAKNLIALKKTLQTGGKANPEPEDDAKNNLEDEALVAIQRAEARKKTEDEKRLAKIPPAGESPTEVEDIPGAQ